MSTPENARIAVLSKVATSPRPFLPLECVDTHPPPLHGEISLVKLLITCVLPKLVSALAKAVCTFGRDHWEAGRMPVFLPSLKITQQILNFLLGRKK